MACTLRKRSRWWVWVGRTKHVWIVLLVRGYSIRGRQSGGGVKGHEDPGAPPRRRLGSSTCCTGVYGPTSGATIGWKGYDGASSIAMSWAREGCSTQENLRASAEKLLVEPPPTLRPHSSDDLRYQVGNRWGLNHRPLTLQF